MKPQDCAHDSLHCLGNNDKAENDVKQMSCALDAKCAKADPGEMAAKITTINPKEQQALLKLL